MAASPGSLLDMQSPTLDLLFQSLHFNKITGDVGGCYGVRNTRTETQIWPCLSPAFKSLRAVSAQGAKPKLLLTFKALSDSTSIYLPYNSPHIPTLQPHRTLHGTRLCPLCLCLCAWCLYDHHSWCIQMTSFKSEPYPPPPHEAYLIKSTQR